MNGERVFLEASPEHPISATCCLASDMPRGVQICGAAASLPDGYLFSTLEKVLPVKFLRADHAQIDVAAELHVHVPDKGTIKLSSSSVPSLYLPRSSSKPAADSHRSIDVTFSNDKEVPFPFRGRTLTTKVEGDEACFSINEHERVLASDGRRAIWTVLEADGIRRYRSALPLPQVAEGENFSDIFNGNRFLGVLPLIHFLRRVGEAAAYQHPPLRAAFIIDDPNLHWPRYGFVDYRQIAENAEKENYHVAFATIPMDAWYTHAETADLFRRGSRRLSLLIHGNNHGKDELARPYPDATRMGLLHQAIRRIERLEAKAGIRVCRVMVPPHGACSSKMLAELPGSGFEAACISAGSLRAHNRDQQWTRALGYAPSENVEGCPVLPRWGLTGSIENTLLVAAYLGQPMILRGHHDDLKHGLGMLESLSQFINGLGDVVWSNLTGLSRLNYLWRSSSAAYQVRPLGTKVVVDLPSGTTDLTIDASTEDSRTWELRFADGSARSLGRGEAILIRATAGQAVVVERAQSQKLDSPFKKAVLPSPALMFRRLLTEARDRFMACKLTN